MNTPQNTTEQQHLNDLVKLVKLAREDVVNEGCNDQQIACDILLYLQYASYKYKNGWQNFNLSTVTQLFEEKMKMESLNKNNIRLSEDSTRIDADSYFDFPDYSSNDESTEVLETNININDSPAFENLRKSSGSYASSHSTIVSSHRSNASSFPSTYPPLTQDLSGPRDSITMKELQRDLSNDNNSYQELDRLNNEPSIPCNLDSNSTTFRPVLQNSSKYGSSIIAAFLESDWPSEDEDETPFSTLIKERGQALYEEKRRQAEANVRGTCDPGTVSLVQVRKAFPINENNMLESSKNASKKIVKNIGKGKKLTKATNKKSKKQTNSIIPSITTSTDSMTSSGLNSLSNTVSGLQVISPRTIISGLPFSEFDQHIEEQERSQTSVKGSKRKVRDCDDVTENVVPGDFDVDKMFEDFDPTAHSMTAHSINVTPGTMYNQLLADISPSIRNRFAANSPGQEFDYLWATYSASTNKRYRKSPKFKEQTIDFEPKVVEARNNTEAIPSSYQASLDAWAASNAVSTPHTPILIEVPSTPPHQIRTASGTRTPGSAFSLSEFLNLSPSPM
ncbi:hypothetical protein RhiirA4_540011 [Rhizophagus irregularis]|uniref:Uncharacterized protein n=1 Tax=Rhizophagus irregularis TaxID=588596 RepID=A0A2I1G5W7_9GLOM|nr:hypothetical protein RhiirA4_540011 [Rhizophagus irregularis]